MEIGSLADYAHRRCTKLARENYAQQWQDMGLEIQHQQGQAASYLRGDNGRL